MAEVHSHHSIEKGGEKPRKFKGQSSNFMSDLWLQIFIVNISVIGKEFGSFRACVLPRLLMD